MTMVWVFSPRQHRHPLNGLCFRPGLDCGSEDWGHIGKYRARRRLPSNPSALRWCLFFPSRRITCPVDRRSRIVGMGLGERFLLIGGAWAPTRVPPEPMMAPGALPKGAGDHAFPASHLPAMDSQPTRELPQGGVLLPPVYASPTVSHVGARVPYRRGRRPLQITRVVSLLLSAFGVQPLLHCRAGHASAQIQLKLSASPIPRQPAGDTAAVPCTCNVGTVHCCTLLRRISIVPQLSSTPKRCSGSSGMRGSVVSDEQ